METNSDKRTVLNTILSVINVSLEVLLALIVLGFLMGLLGLTS